MFELLLQADKALAGGQLDQAEKTYWQLIDLDPTNAIAVAGLARVSLGRGDERAARSFADQALGIDPDSIAARRVLETIEHKTVEPSKPGPAELPLLAVERLEALSRRRGEESQRGQEVGGVEPAGGQKAAGAQQGPGPRKASGPQKAIAKAKSAVTSVATSTTPPAAGAVATGKSGHRPEAAPGQAEATRTQAEAGPGPARSKESRGRTRPDQIVPLPSEPLRERRQAGRLAAAAAAAAAAARMPVHPRREPHHAMPVGRRLFGPEGLKASPADPFSEAEMAAAVAAVDDLDDAGGVAGSGELPPAMSGFGATDATTPEESVALRVALLADVAELEDAERGAARSIDEPAGAGFAAAEEGADSALAAERKSVEPTPDEPAEPVGAPAIEPLDSIPAGPLDLADADTAELAAPAEAVHEVAAGVAEAEPEPRRARRPLPHPGGEEQSEEEAEAQALREALAMVLEGDAGSETEEVPATVTEHVRATEQAAAEPAGEPPAGAEPTTEKSTGPDSTHPKHGLFHRIRGS
jgi:hypothetical protein